MKIKWLASIVISVSLVSSYVMAENISQDIDYLAMNQDDLYRILGHNDWPCRENSEYVLYKNIIKSKQVLHNKIIDLMTQGRYHEGMAYTQEFTDKLKNIKSDNMSMHFKNTCGFYNNSKPREFSL